MWSKQEEEILNNYYGKIPNIELLNLLPGKSLTAIQSKARRLNIQKKEPDWSEQEIKILYENFNYNELQNLLSHRSIDAIRNKKYNLDITNQTYYWSEKELNILKDNYSTLDNRSLQKLLPNRHSDSIKQMAFCLGLIKYKPAHDINFFNLPTIQNSYWAGFIAGDGHIINGKQSCSLVIELQKRDKVILEEFKKIAYIEQVIKPKSKFDKRTNKTYESYVLRVNNINLWGKHLQKHWNITSRKTFTLLPPNTTNNDCNLAFIIGLIDSDGCISIVKKHNQKPYLQLQIVGTEKLINWVSDVLYRIENPDIYKPLKVYKSKKIHSITCSHNRAKALLEFLDTIILPFKLRRKWDKIKELNA